MHQSNVKNRTIFCRDNLQVLQGINSSSIDLIYLDPPFNKKKIFSAPIGSSAEGADFRDWFRKEDVKDEWIQEIKEDYDGLYKFLNNVKELSSIVNTTRNKHYLYNYCYLCYMAIRLIEMRRILKDTGSIYLHCDNTMGHYLKILMDIIFGEKNFRNSIVWGYSHGGKGKRDFARKHDIILRFVKSNQFFFNGNAVGFERQTGKKSKGGRLGIDELGRPYQDKIVKKTKKVYRYYLDEGKIPEDYWTDINSLQAGDKERTGYPTQKPLALLERIIKASSHEEDIVLDAFCGCATTCIAAEKLKRQWIGIDVSVKAYELVKKRLKEEVANPNNLLQYNKEIVFSTDPPRRTDQNGDDALIKKYVYIISHPKYKGEYKVGIASDIQARLTSYQTSDPDRKYQIKYKKHTHLFRKIEKLIHEKYENKHEWIKGNLQDIINDIENYT
ncbi:hypothetical protein COTS27_01367 [Spirochaetota bacterium]|nr:hypothetical protein COTS27_01367 [Spirochaetota bacterium]